ncbi:cupin-like domain-containing protein [Gamsiella multidivaricata]|uniref:cupin-like domain-containing protein n=1 Tax=Gamsiella multidivaricata TaxID=101098 RepID=UPI002220B77C|nr:cupin-like domain-containing protein [Gamsiella multidivaricata]KAG0368905.1 JmjC domain-containing protein 7 [Gamsiella multidivaricata]KAI7822886.1 cupin-like domain-containing protein [Gamsiella multidivaricata]
MTGLGPGSKVRNASEIKMRLEEEICSLISEVQDFNLSTIERIELPTALEFHRYVAANRPVVISLPASCTTIHEPSSSRAAPTSQEKQWAWPAFTKWTNEYLSDTLGNKEITVACTPNGWADAVVDDKYFAMPCEKKMTFEKFLEGMPIRTPKKRDAQSQDSYEDLEARTRYLELESRDLNGVTETTDPYQEVRYIQLQNGNLMTEYEELLEDVPSEIQFASEALGKKPDAVNFWYGDERSTTSLHKDHYENIYGVITGRKIFTLIPPTEQYCLHENHYIAATYVDTQDSSSSPSQPSSPSSPRYKLEPMEPLTYTKWIGLNPSHEPKEELYEKFPRFHMCQPFRVELNPGELLYLPAMWYHQVEQEPDHEGKCIAVNWWYDMGFEGDRFATATFMSNLVQLIDQIDVSSE